MFKILTGWEFEIEWLPSVFLSRGLTQATFGLLGKILYLKLLFVATDNDVLTGSATFWLKLEELYVDW